MDVPKICLNMIVKNESAIIIRLLESVTPLIDSYCICDTGSTDNTIELIEQYFKDKKINGVIFHETFKESQGGFILAFLLGMYQTHMREIKNYWKVTKICSK